MFFYPRAFSPFIFCVYEPHSRSRRASRYYSHVGPQTFYLCFRGVQRCILLTCLVLFLVAEGILERLIAPFRCLCTPFYPPPCIPFNKNSADAAEITLRFEMKNDGECESWRRMQRAKLCATRTWRNLLFLFSWKNHIPTTERIMLLNKDVAEDYRLILL